MLRSNRDLPEDGAQSASIDLTVVWDYSLRVWVISSHNDVAAVLTTDRKPKLLKC
jgi:hypothetical protein